MGGCDSSYTTRLQFYTVYNERNRNVMHGRQYILWRAWQTLAGVYTDTLVSVQGCDSLVNTTLDFYAAAYDSITTNICRR